MVCKRIIDLFTENHVVAIDKCRYLVYTTSITIKQRSRKEHNMTRNEAKLKLFTTNRQIEAKVNEHTSASSRYKKTSIMNELEVLWARKDILKNIINS